MSKVTPNQRFKRDALASRCSARVPSFAALTRRRLT